MVDLKKELEFIGFSEKESVIYVTSLTLGQATVQQIAQKAGIKRATTYVVIENLMRDGLMSSIHKGKKQYFLAEDPTRLTDYIERKKQELQNKEEKTKELVSELQKFHQKSEVGPTVKYYTGKEGALAMIKNLLSFSGDEEVWMAYPVEPVYDIFTEEERKAVRFSRLEKNIRVRSLYTSKKDKLPNTKTSERIRIDSKEYPIDADIAVYGDMVRLTSLKDEIVGVMIENKDIANTLKSIFKLAWKSQQNKNKPSQK